MKDKPSIVFFGAGPVACRSLELIIDKFTIEAIITKPKIKKNIAPVLDFANEHNISTFTPKNRIELDEIFNENSFNSQVGLVIDFGIIISKAVIDYFDFGIVNSHFSLLPEWRGADPITFALLSGQKTTGVSLMRIVEALDEGPIIAQESHEISKDTDIQHLTESLVQLSAGMLPRYIPKYLAGQIQLTDQESITKSKGIKPSYSRKLTKQDGLINWDKPAEVIEREIRAFRGWPQSRCQLNGLDLIITEAEISQQSLLPGEIKVDGKKLYVGCQKQSLEILSLKPAGKNAMDSQSFIAGYKERLSSM